MTREEILNKAHQLAEKYFPDSQNIWARPNIEAQKVNYACMEMAEWLEKVMIEKAYEWLKQNAEDYVVTCYDEGELNDEDLLNDFKRAMEE